MAESDEPALPGPEAPAAIPATAPTPDDQEKAAPTSEANATSTPSPGPVAHQPKQRSDDEQTSPASAPFVKQQADAVAEARAAAAGLIPRSSENTIAPYRNLKAPTKNGNGEEAAQTPPAPAPAQAETISGDSVAAQETTSASAEEEQA